MDVENNGRRMIKVSKVIKVNSERCCVLLTCESVKIRLVVESFSRCVIHFLHFDISMY